MTNEITTGEQTHGENRCYQGGLHRWSIALVLVVFPLIWIGGLVTTTDSGMAVPDWPNTYGYNLFLYPVYDWFFGPWDLFVEHGHRLLATLAGLLTIVVAVMTWRNRNERPGLNRVALIAVVMVVVQGVLGGLRVVLDQRTLAMIHGCFGPAYFMVTVSILVVSSRWWSGCAAKLPETRITSGFAFQRFSLMMLLGSFVQLVIGANLRHVSEFAPPDYFQWLVVAHVVLAVAIAFGSFVLYWMCRHRAWREAKLTRYGALLVFCVLIQIGLGVGTWAVKFGWPWFLGDWPFAARFVVPEKSFLQMNLITAHVATGSLILGLLTLLVCRSCRVWQVFNPEVAIRPLPARDEQQSAQEIALPSSCMATGVN